MKSDSDKSCDCSEIYSSCETLGNYDCTKNVLAEIKMCLMIDKWDPELSSKFLKIRHNFFADCFMSDYDVPYSATDYKLSNIGIDSDLSPDIYLGNEGGIHKFIEFFVSLDPVTALSSKRQKYSDVSKENNLEILYIYFDMRNMLVMEDSSDVSPSEIYKFYGNDEGYITPGYSLNGFISTIKELSGVMKYLKMDSNEVDVENITPGKDFEGVLQNIYYRDNLMEFSNREYRTNLKYILDKLSGCDDNLKYSIYFDQYTRRFSVKRGTYDLLWLMKAVREEKIMESIVVYEDSSQGLNTVVEEVNNEELEREREEIRMGNKAHKFIISPRGSFHNCLERAKSPKEIFDDLNNLDFDGLYKKKLGVSEVISQSERFYEEWKRRCISINVIKLKTTFMLPIPSVDRIDDVIGNIKGFGRLNSRMIEVSRLVPLTNPTNRSRDDLLMIDKDLNEKYQRLNETEHRMREIRKIMNNIYGTNEASYKIQMIIEICRKEIKKSKGDWIPELLLRRIRSSNEMGDLEDEYCGLSLKKTRETRKIRQIMKGRITRENMYTFNNQEYKEYRKECEECFKRKKDGDERMGYYGYNGHLEFDDLSQLFSSFWEYLCNETTAFKDWFNVDVSDASFPKNVAGKDCKDYYSFYKVCVEKIRKTRIYRLILWISNLARSIWAISTYKTKKRKLIIDRCGSRGTILFVCSTGNIQKFKSSKAFKVLIPTDSAVREFMGYRYIPGWDSGVDEYNREYSISHWMYMKIQHLKYFMELPGRWIQTISCIMSEYNITNIRTHLYMYLTYCCLNARRKNENLLHDLKYMTYNMFGSMGCYSDLLNDKLEIPRDLLERYIEEKFLKRIPVFMKSLEKNQLLSVAPYGSYPSYALIHPLGEEEDTLDVFNLYVYSSYIFPKGVFTHQTEQSVNMKSILEVHDKAMSILSGANDYYSVKTKTDVEISEIFNNDLYYNSGVVSAVGLYCEHYLATHGAGLDFRSQWANIINKDITEYANSHGLRENNLSESKSWGKKGHDVMTSMISQICDSNIINELESMNPKTIKDCTKMKWKVMRTKYTISDYSHRNPISSIELNNANKVQWGGSREIYIMTIGAKNIQWSLEQMFANISKSLDNEFIHIPAADRFNKLYDIVKESPHGIRYYLTLDCRKWAPLSNINKYLVFVNSMSGILPKEFVEDFNYFFTLYYKKKLFFKSIDVESFLKGENMKYVNYFKKSGCGYYIEMPYSFMMGMFNYLSSIVHAISQKYFTENIIPIIAKMNDCKIKMVMMAHSDDSGGYLEISGSSDSDHVLREVIKMYESFQKCLNHMLSLKKCTVGTSYFEITSYCFMKTDPMPVLPKFIYSHQINLTPAGYISDVKSISSSVVEMITNGSSFRTSFIKYLTLGQTYRIFCVGRKINDLDALTYYDLGGYPMIHPYYLMVYKSYAEPKWISEIANKYYSANQSVLEALGMVDPWGRRNGLKVNMISMKERKNDGRFIEYEKYEDIPDELIPSGHFACYMRKMSTKYYKDVMWFSMHDIDGTLIQSNMFNNGINQSYQIIDEQYPVKDAIIKLVSMVHSSVSDELGPRFPEFITQISSIISLNDSPNYQASNVRAKPTEINTYYNKWWRNKSRETKLIALIKLCPWMGLLSSRPMEYYTCLQTANNVKISDIMNSIAEEEPLMRQMVTTRSEARLIDRFDTISSWIFYNSYPMMQPTALKRKINTYNILDEEVHPECLAAIIYEAIETDKVLRINDIKVATKGEDSITYTDAMPYLMRKPCDDPIYSMVVGINQSSWMNSINFISIRNNQYSRYGRYWIGRTVACCRINQRSYELVIDSGKIMNIRCKSQYSIKRIIEDMSEIDPFGFSMMMSPSDYKTKPENRITKDPGGGWIWTEGGLGMPYYPNIIVDGGMSYENKLGFDNKSTVDQQKEESIKQENIQNKRIESYKERQLYYYPEGRSKYRAYILHKKPCEYCLKHCSANGMEFLNCDKTTYTVECSLQCLMDHWRETKAYEMIYNEYEKYRELVPDHAEYMGQIGTIESAIYTGPKDNDGSNYYSEYRGELFLSSMSTMNIDSNVIDTVRSNLSDFVRFKLVGDQIMCVSDPKRINDLISEHGTQAVSAAIVTLPMERSIEYYSLMTYDDYWYNNTQLVPEVMIDAISYIYSTIQMQPGQMNHKKRIFQSIINEIVNYIATVYHCQRRDNYKFGTCEDIWLYYLFKEFKDVGDCPDESVSQRFYYDPISVYGSISAWMRYAMTYSGRRSGRLVENYEAVYYRTYAGFVRKFKSIAKDKFQISVNQRNITSIKACKIPHFELYGIDFSTPVRIYPLKGCYPDDLCQEEEYYEDDIMTKDVEDSMISYNYNPDEDYDFCNHSIYMVKGSIKRIKCLDRDEWSYWRCIDVENAKFEFTEKGQPPIGVSKTGFMIGGAITNLSQREFEITNNLSFSQKIESSESILDYMIYKINTEATMTGDRILKKENIIHPEEGKRLVIDNSIIAAMMAKFDIFSMILDVSGNLTPLLEGKRYESISNLSRPLNNSLFDQMAIAELEKISPGITRDMQTDSFRLYKGDAERIVVTHNSAIYRDRAHRFTIGNIIRSAIVVDHMDQMAVNTMDRIYNIIRLFGIIPNQENSEAIPNPEHNRSEDLRYRRIIGI